MQINAKHYATGKPIRLSIEAGKLVEYAASKESTSLWFAPSLFDVQINGCLGVGFNSPTLTPDGVRTVVAECRKHGIAQFCPTIITDSFEAIERGFRTLAEARNADALLAVAIPGYHLEGPYLCADDGPRGAHPKEYCRNPNWDEFQRWQTAAEGHIRMVTLAPERDGAMKFIEQLATVGIVVAIGHTNANPQQIRDAVAAGARTSTHLGNGSHAMLPRHENYIWEQLGNDDLWASVISDGHHLPNGILKSIVRAKGLDRLLVTCDASSLAGLPPGRYTDWGMELEVQAGGKVVVPGTPFLAGSGCFTDQCVSHIMRVAGLSLSEAIDLASLQPRRLLNLPEPTFEIGESVLMMLFEWEPGGDLAVKSII